MFFNEWHILIVDDEPDVLAVTKLALKDIRVYGLPVVLHTAQSKAEAIAALNGPLALTGVPEGQCAVALIDVVMESDQAGLELCEHIRTAMNNHSVQLFIRTGQPGLAPERKVIDDYDISGYFTKMELTEQKLYTLVKSGVRQWFSNWYARLIAEATNTEVAASATRSALLASLGFVGESGPQPGEPVTGMVFEDRVPCSDYPLDDLRAMRDTLSSLPATISAPGGHTLTSDAKGRVLVNIQPTETTAAFFYVSDSPMVMPRALLDITFQNGLVLATLWKRAAPDVP